MFRISEQYARERNSNGNFMHFLLHLSPECSYCYAMG